MQCERKSRMEGGECLCRVAEVCGFDHQKRLSEEEAFDFPFGVGLTKKKSFTGFSGGISSK